MKNLLIIGSGSQSRYVIDIVRHTQSARLMGIIDVENPQNVGRLVNEIPVLGMFEELINKFSPNEYQVIVAYGINRRKYEIVKRLEGMGFSFANAISHLAYISPSALIGSGCIINPFATIMPNARIGHHVIIHSHCVIEHDNVIGDYVNIAPGVSLAGNVEVGQGSYIYTGANVAPKVRIGSWSIVGAGAAVIRDVPNNDVVVGVPARSILRR